MHTVVKENGLLECQIYGDITGIDCSCLRSDKCKGCFIYMSSKESEQDYSDMVSEHSLIASSKLNTEILH